MGADVVFLRKAEQLRPSAGLRRAASILLRGACRTERIHPGGLRRQLVPPPWVTSRRSSPENGESGRDHRGLRRGTRDRHGRRGNRTWQGARLVPPDRRGGAARSEVHVGSRRRTNERSPASHNDQVAALNVNLSLVVTSIVSDVPFAHRYHGLASRCHCRHRCRCRVITTEE